MRIVFWDLETTGLNPYHDQIIEIAAVDNIGGHFHSLIKNSSPLNSKVIAITGITDQMLKDQPTLDETIPEFMSFIEGADWLVGHNSIKFDVFFMRACLSRVLPTELPSFNRILHLDTLAIAQIKHAGLNSYSLTSLCKYLQIDQDGAHRALSDVRSTQSLFNRLLNYEQTAEKCRRYYQSIFMT